MRRGSFPSLWKVLKGSAALDAELMIAVTHCTPHWAVLAPYVALVTVCNALQATALIVFSVSAVSRTVPGVS